jgi:hypothetical protein
VYGAPSAAKPRGNLVARHPWWTAAIAIVLFSALLVHWARTRPSYDAYGWLVWGYQTLRLHLDLGGAPSWKPLPYLFTVPYALAGSHQLFLWMVTAVSAALAASVFAGRIAYRTVAADVPATRWPAIGAAIFAGGSVLALQDYTHYILSVQSDPVIVALTLGAIDMHLCGHRRWAFALGTLAALGRPEAWCLLGPYSIYLWLRQPETRLMVAGGWAVILFMWFGIPTITNHRPFVSAQLATGSPRELRSGQIHGTLERFFKLYMLPIWLATLGTIIWAALRRKAVVLILAAAAALWVITEIAFALHGWPGLPRYLFEAGAICGVIAAIGFGWLLGASPALGHNLPRLVGWILALALVVVLIPAAKARYDTESHDLAHERARTTQINWMLATFSRVGGVPLIRSCGAPAVDVEWASALAYAMHLNVGSVGYRPIWDLRRRHHPIVVFNALSDGWQVIPAHLRRADRERCEPLSATLAFSAGHRGGILERL